MKAADLSLRRDLGGRQGGVLSPSIFTVAAQSVGRADSPEAVGSREGRGSVSRATPADALRSLTL